MGVGGRMQWSLVSSHRELLEEKRIASLRRTKRSKIGAFVALHLGDGEIAL